MICFVTDIQHDREPDILGPVRNMMLTVRDLDGAEIAAVAAPDGGWTHPALVLTAQELAVKTDGGADAFIGGCWVGSTEV